MNSCNLGRGQQVEKDLLLAAFNEWCDELDLDEHYDMARFAKELRSASGQNIDSSRPRINGIPVHHFTGVTFKV